LTGEAERLQLPGFKRRKRSSMSIVKEFREFIARGNVIDLAVGVIIGAAFNSIVKSLVDQVIMPPIGLLMGGLDFSKLEWVLKPEDPATRRSRRWRSSTAPSSTP
jgi:hypothetical protein